MLDLLRSLVEAAGPFMEHQASTAHFEFLGLDVLADEMGGVWLIEGDWSTLLLIDFTIDQLDGCLMLLRRYFAVDRHG